MSSRPVTAPTTSLALPFTPSTAPLMPSSGPLLFSPMVIPLLGVPLRARKVDQLSLVGALPACTQRLPAPGAHETAASMLSAPQGPSWLALGPLTEGCRGHATGTCHP